VQGSLRVFILTLKPQSYKIYDVLDAGPGYLLGLCDGPLYHWFHVDLGVPALKAHQHVLCHYLSQDTTLYL
jgi:hypothetical protein